MALMPEPVWNCQTTLPVSASTAMNSPVSLPVNSRPPPVASIADQIWKSISGVRLLLLRGERIDGLHVAERLIRRPRQRQVLDEHVALADLEGLGLEVLVHAALVERVRVEEPGLRVERGVRPVLAAARRRPVLGGLHVADAL